MLILSTSLIIITVIIRIIIYRRQTCIFTVSWCLEFIRILAERAGEQIFLNNLFLSSFWWLTAWGGGAAAVATLWHLCPTSHHEMETAVFLLFFQNDSSLLPIYFNVTEATSTVLSCLGEASNQGLSSCINRRILIKL